MQPYLRGYNQNAEEELQICDDGRGGVGLPEKAPANMTLGSSRGRSRLLLKLLLPWHASEVPTTRSSSLLFSTCIHGFC